MPELVPARCPVPGGGTGIVDGHRILLREGGTQTRPWHSGKWSSRARLGGRTRPAIGRLARAPQDRQALLVLLLADLAAGEPLGEQPPAAPSPPQSAEALPSPERLLAERFARGEIGEEEYRQRVAVLRGADQPANGQARPAAGTSTR